MINDWNWFFSSVAQSSAAIVGIFAAFIITKIINNQLEYNKLIRYSSKMILESEKLIEKSRATKIAWYNDEIFKVEILKMVDALQRRQIDQPEQYQFRWKFSPFMPKWYLDHKLNEYFQSYKQKRATSGKSMKELIMASESAAGMLIPHHEQLAKEEGKIINNLINDVRHNIREIKSLLEEISRNPQSSNLITFSIIGTLLMFIVGVIYPLYSLPYGFLYNYPYDVRLLVLGSIFFIFTTIMTVFVAINIKLKYPLDLISRLQTFCNMESYSPYFKDIDEKFTLR